METIFSVKEAARTFGLKIHKPDPEYPSTVYIEGGVAEGAYSVSKQALEGGADKKEKGYDWFLSEVPVRTGDAGRVRRIQINLPSKWFKDLFVEEDEED
jgi:hypothetical protein